MFFLGDFLGDIFSIADTPTNVNNSTILELENGFYDELYVGQNDDLNAPDDTIPTEFGISTIMRTKFNESANAGNVDWSTKDVNHLTLQRRKLGTNNWVVLEEKKIRSIDDFQFSGVDITAAAETD